MSEPILTPMLALILWTFAMWLWMYATRIPAMSKAGIDPGKIQQKGELDVLPVEVKRIADNYNHLHEQPVIFYALVVYAVLAGTVSSVMISRFSAGHSSCASWYPFSQCVHTQLSFG